MDVKSVLFDGAREESDENGCAPFVAFEHPNVKYMKESVSELVGVGSWVNEKLR